MSFRDRRKSRVDVDESEIEMNDTTMDMLNLIAGTERKPTAKTIQQVNTLVAAGIAPAADGTLAFKDFRLTRVGLTTVGDVSYEDWNNLGNLLRQIEVSLQWLIGDWIVMGEKVYGQTYEEIALLTGYEVKTLYDYAYVAANVEFSVRTENLSFGHHKIVASLPPSDQQYWLGKASKERWAIARLRKEMDIERGFDPGQQPPYLRDTRASSLKILKHAQNVQPHERQQMIQEVRELLNRLERM